MTIYCLGGGGERFCKDHMVFRGGTEYKGGTIDNFLPIYCNEGGHKNITEPYGEGGGCGIR